MNEWGWSVLPMTHSFFPARTGETMRSPPWEFRTRGPKKSPATTLTVLAGEASLARSSSVRTPRLPPCAVRGPASVIGRSGSL